LFVLQRSSAPSIEAGQNNAALPVGVEGRGSGACLISARRRSTKTAPRDQQGSTEAADDEAGEPAGDLADQVATK